MVLLKEFDFDLPEYPEKRKLFRLQTRCITSLFERLFEKYKTEGCWKILIECVEKIVKVDYRDLLGVYTIQIQFSPESFFSLSNFEKKQQTLELLMKGIESLVLQTGWDIMPFEHANQACKDLNLTNEWLWKKPVISPSKKFMAEVMAEHELEFCHINVIIRDRKKNEILREKIISEVPHEFAFARHLGHLSWVSENEVILQNQNKDRIWRVNIRQLYLQGDRVF
jgi:hypothetical protein